MQASASTSARVRARRSALALLLGACSPGVGGPPAPRDAGEAASRVDAATPDATSALDATSAFDAAPRGDRDAGPLDAGPLDAGAPARLDFTGVFGILNDAAPLYAREVDGQLMLVIGAFPYVYLGAIDADGAVRTTGGYLEGIGCPEARVDGVFARGTGAFALRHATCNAALMPVVGDLRGGIGSDFEADRSGVYAVEARVGLDVAGCYRGPSPVGVRYALNQHPSGALQVFVVDGPFPGGYLGRLRPGLEAANLEQRVPGGGAVAMSLSFPLTPATQPQALVGQRDVYDPARGCAFRFDVQGARIKAP